MKVVYVSDKLFPVGSAAWHEQYEFCYIVEADHFRRTILYEAEPDDYQVAEVVVHDLLPISYSKQRKK